MTSIMFLFFVLLVFSLIFSKIKVGRLALWAKLFRIVTLAISIGLFTYWFIKKSTIGIVKNSISLQVINKLPQPIDFYMIIVNNLDGSGTQETKHIGNIRSEYYRIEHLKMDKSDQYWVVGYLGKKNMVYFSQHAIPNKNMDQVVEVQNYINQSEKLSAQAKKKVESYNFQNIVQSIWVTLNFLLIFINVSLFWRKK